MKTAELRNKFLKYKTVETGKTFVKQRNCCASLVKKSKSSLYSNLYVKDNTDSKKFSKIFFPKSAVLKENKKIVENQNEVANIFNDFFSKVVLLFQIPESNNIDSSVMKYRRHPSITAIQDAYKRSSFSFSTVEKVDVITKSKTSFMMMIFLLKY